MNSICAPALEERTPCAVQEPSLLSSGEGGGQGREVGQSWDPACTSVRRSWPRLGPCPPGTVPEFPLLLVLQQDFSPLFFFWIPFSSLWFSSLGLHPLSNQFSFLRPPEQVSRLGSLNGKACCPTAWRPGGGRAGQLLLKPRGPSQPPSSQAPLHHLAWRCPLLLVSHRLPSLSKPPFS